MKTAALQTLPAKYPQCKLCGVTLWRQEDMDAEGACVDREWCLYNALFPLEPKP